MLLIKDLGTRLINNKWRRFGIFKCLECSKEVERRLDAGKRDKSCGCQKKNYKHGGKNTKLYSVWNGMKQRILNPNTINYKDYGGRGITICDDWLAFIPFRDWALNNGYADTLEIDRIENNKGYSPENCHFVTRQENSRNTRANKIKSMEIANEIRYLYSIGEYTQKQLAEIFGVSQRMISYIINFKRWGG